MRLGAKNMKETTKEEMLIYVIGKGWEIFGDDDYWINPNIVENKKTQNYKDYGMTLKEAFTWEKFELGKVSKMFELPRLSLAAHLAAKIKNIETNK
jgi:hypothetical protein